jgi:hypothetical protein
MIRYNVRSRYLVDLINEVKENKLILAPYFQRKLVWRIGHKIDFIKTILLGYPFPEVFISRGKIDLQTMQSTSALVDGQQRLSTIREYLADGFAVDGKKYSELSPGEQEQILKYEIAIIDLDLQQDDPQIREIFKRLNRTFYALSTIEKLSTEFGSSEFMLVAKLLSGEFKDPDSEAWISPTRPEHDPNVSVTFIDWAGKQKIGNVVRVFVESPIFSKYEISRQVHLMFTLNIMATLIGGYYNRNDHATDYLETRAETFPEKQDIVERLEKAATLFHRLRFRADSSWFGKSNAFTLLITLGEFSDRLDKLDVAKLRELLNAFFVQPPAEYALAAKEGVNNRKERLLRATEVRSLIEKAF